MHTALSERRSTAVEVGSQHSYITCHWFLKTTKKKTTMTKGQRERGSVRSPVPQNKGWNIITVNILLLSPQQFYQEAGLLKHFET